MSVFESDFQVLARYARIGLQYEIATVLAADEMRLTQVKSKFAEILVAV